MFFLTYSTSRVYCPGLQKDPLFNPSQVNVASVLVVGGRLEHMGEALLGEVKMVFYMSTCAAVEVDWRAAA